MGDTQQRRGIGSLTLAEVERMADVVGIDGWLLALALTPGALHEGHVGQTQPIG